MTMTMIPRPMPHVNDPFAPLFDSFGRKIENIRISVTDRCNFRCQYCMPAEGLPWLANEKVLTFAEIERLARLFVRLGIKEIRLTGGEPTVRAKLPDLIAVLSQIEGLENLSMTTNGYRLKSMAGDLARAGLRRINVSLDTLVREKFTEITRRDAFDQVIAGLEELEKYPSIHPIKINVVAIKDFTESEVCDFARFARRKPYIVRFLEFMPLDADGNWEMHKVLKGAELKAMIEAEFGPLVPVHDGDASATARRYRFSDGVGEIGFINPVTEPFCAQCNRIRLTADGQLRTCLFSVDETDLRLPLREGAGDEELATVIRRSVWLKEKKHKINEGAAFQRASRSMSQIGG